MDNSKDFIRIDDVFRRMRDADGSGNHGSWSEMKNLLDKNMPESSSTSQGRAWRLTALMLVILLLAGGLYLWQNFPNHSGEILANTTPTKRALHTQNKAIPTITNNNHSAPPTAPKAQTNKTVIAGSQQNRKTQTVVGTTTKHPFSTQNNANHNNNNPKQNQTALSTVATVQNASNTHLHKQPSNSKQNKEVAKDLVINQYRNKAVKPIEQLSDVNPQNLVTSTPKEANPAPIKPLNIPSNVATIQATLPVIKKDKVIAQIQPKYVAATTTGNTNTKMPKNGTGEKIAKNHGLKKVGLINKHIIYQSQNGGLYKERTDTFERLDINRRMAATNDLRHLNQPQKPILDTLAIYKMERISFIPLSYLEAKQVIHIANLPLGDMASDRYLASTSGANNNNEVALVPLDKYRVSRHHIHSGFFYKLLHTPQGIAGFLNGNKPWYMAFMAGGNVGIGAPNTYGMQVGINFLYSIAQRWTLSLELEYQHQYYNSFRFFDYATNYNVQGTPKQVGTEFSGTATRHQTTYKVDQLSRINLPLLLSYDLGKVSIFTGAEFAYFFPLKNSHSESVSVMNVSKLAYNNANPFVNQSYELNPQTGFQSRFGIGYAVGARYDFSRKFSISARLNQIIWDNSGVYKIDAVQKMYHQPAVQLNFGFYLGRREKVIYIIDQHH